MVALIPSVYLLIYLSSIWDPVAQASALPVGIVNLDGGYTYRDQSFNIGHDVTTKLQEKNQFGYRQIDRDEDARQQVRQGKLAFALLIPPDFSANAIPGLSAGGGQLSVYTSAGNNYESAILARQFAKALGEEVNDALNAQRWALVEAAVLTVAMLLAPRAFLAGFTADPALLAIGVPYLRILALTIIATGVEIATAETQLKLLESLAGKIREFDRQYFG